MTRGGIPERLTLQGLLGDGAAHVTHGPVTHSHLCSCKQTQYTHWFTVPGLGQVIDLACYCLLSEMTVECPAGTRMERAGMLL